MCAGDEVGDGIGSPSPSAVMDTVNTTRNLPGLRL